VNVAFANRPWQLLRGAIVWAAIGATGGCAGGLHSDAPPTQVYVLRAIARPQAELIGRSGASLRVGRPIAGPGLDSDHIVLVQPDHRMSYYVGSRWPDGLPAVVEALAVDTLRTSGVWSTVQDSSSTFSSEYILQIVIRRFEADYISNAGQPEVHVVLDCTVGKRTGREIITSFVAEGSSRAAANRLGEVVSAFEDAANQALGAIAERTLQAVQGASEHHATTGQNVETPVPSITR
jgi:ABC-type uncharacterized transport system auxiliary subunit